MKSCRKGILGRQNSKCRKILRPKQVCKETNEGQCDEITVNEGGTVGDVANETK